MTLELSSHQIETVSSIVTVLWLLQSECISVIQSPPVDNTASSIVADAAVLFSAGTFTGIALLQLRICLLVVAAFVGLVNVTVQTDDSTTV